MREMYTGIRNYADTVSRNNHDLARVNATINYVHGLTDENNESIMTALENEARACRLNISDAIRDAKADYLALISKGQDVFVISDLDLPRCVIRIYEDAVAIIEGDDRTLFYLDEDGSLEDCFFSPSLEIAFESGMDLLDCFEAIIPF